MYIKVRAEEVLIGAVLGAGFGFALVAPFAAGMPALLPSASEGAWGFAQSLAAVTFAGAFAAIGAWKAARQEQDTHVRGARYFSEYSEAQKALQEIERKRFSKAQEAGSVRGIRIGGVEFSRARETEQANVFGTTGSGKTAFVNSVVDQVRARGDRLLTHDPKTDFIKRYYDAKTCVILGPWDSRGAIWDAGRDISNANLANEFGKAVCGGGAAGAHGQNQSFHDNASKVLSGVIRSFMVGGRVWTWSDLRAVLASDAYTLVKTAALGDPAIKTVMPSTYAGDPIPIGEGASLSILQTSSEWLSNYAMVDIARPDALRFSLRDWLLLRDHQEIKTVILNSNKDYPEAGQAVFGAMLAIVASTINSPAMPEKDPDAGDGLWAMLDESPQLGKKALELIQTIAELGRSRGVRLMSFMQAESQMEGAVGREKAGPMLDVQGSRIYLHSSDRTADAVSRRIGEREIKRVSTTAEGGATQGKTKTQVTQRVIQPSDLMGLRVRKFEEPKGVELILNLDDILGKLLNPFPERWPDVAPGLVECEAWKRGTLPEAKPEVAASGESQAQDRGGYDPSLPPDAQDDPAEDDSDNEAAGDSAETDAESDDNGPPIL